MKHHEKNEQMKTDDQMYIWTYETAKNKWTD